MLDEGVITDAKNNTINLNNNIIIMTSNLGFEEIKVGFSKEKSQGIKGSLMKKFPPSLINRIDTIITFNTLEENDIKTIIKKKLRKLEEKYTSLVCNDKVIEDIVVECEYKEYGARRIDKIIDTKLESLIIDKMLNEEPLIIDGLKEYQV